MTPTIDVDENTGYFRPKGRHNAELTEVGRGTPMGELMRRYWLPVALSADAGELPREVRALGEDLVLFRDKQGRPGLLHKRCAHRGASLLFGRIEDEGVRCCYHGWLFDTKGRCLDQPGEPDGGTRKGKVRQPWYPVQDRYGVIFTYMGPPEKKPLLPKYNVLEELGDEDKLFAYDLNTPAVCPEPVVPFNWLQHFENIHDPAHFYWLHYLHSGPQFGERFGEMSLDWIRAELPNLVRDLEYKTTNRGVSAIRRLTLPDGRLLRNVLEVALPVVRVVPSPFGEVGPVDTVGFVLPVDSTSFRIFTVLRAKDRTRIDFEAAFLADYAENWPTERRQRFPNDFEAQNSQGPITLHSEEHLTRGDRGVVTIRRLYQDQLIAIRNGHDPLGVHFEPGTELVNFEAGSYISDAATADGACKKAVVTT